MSNPKLIIITESEKELITLLKSCSLFFRPRLLMLIELKKNKEYGISKRDLADLVGVNHNSIQNWRNLYEKRGLIGIMSHNRTGFKPSVISKDEHKGLKDVLSDPSSGLQGYKELKYWFEDKYNKAIPYTTITGYCIRHFKTKIKVARKSHVKKDEEAGERFKKTLIMTCLKFLS